MKRSKLLICSVLVTLLALCLALGACTTGGEEKHTHEYTFTVSKEASCLSEGSKHGVCSCGETMVVTIPKIDHTVVYHDGKEATCVEDGKTGSAYCNLCDTKLGDGEVIKKLGHSYGEWEETISSTQTVKGEKRRECERCGRYEYAELPLLGHNYVKSESVEPSCASKGYTVYRCTDCEDYYYDDFVPALEHTYVYYGSATTLCDEETYDSAECSVCGFVAYVEIHPAMGHNYGEWEISTPSTCTQDGEEIRKCKRCGEKETRSLISTGHDYVEVAGEEEIFICTICDDLVRNELITDIVNEIYLHNEPNDFEFYVLVNEEGDFTEEYVRKNLSIYNTIFFEAEGYEEYGLHNYSVEKIESNRFRIYVDEENLYEAGYTYNVNISDLLVFEEYNTKKINFTIENEETFEVTYNSELVFLNALETQNPGYNASEIEFDEESGLMYITVWKTDGIEVGDILFIGNATSAEELLNLEEEGHFGKVVEITPNTKEEFVIIMGAPEEAEIFDDLDIYFEDGIDFTKSKDFNDQVSNEAVEMLLRSEDFNKFLAASENASETFFAPMGLKIVPLIETDLQSSLKFNPTCSINGKQIVISINGRLERTVECEDNTLKANGKFYIDFTATIEFEFDIALNYKIKYRWFIPTGIKHFNFTLTQRDTFSFTFEIGFDMACSNLMSNFVYYDGEMQKTIHIASCLHLKRIKDVSKIKKLTLEELEEYFEDNNYHCCKTCNPKKLHSLSVIFILSKNTKVVHTNSCPMKGNILEENFEYSNESLDKLLEEGYSCCGHCHPEEEEANFGFAEYLTQSLASADIGETIDKIKKWTKASDNKDLDDTIYLCKVEIPIFEIISVTVEVSLVIDFKLEISLTYEYIVSHKNQFGMRYEDGKIKSSYNYLENVEKNEITLTGSIEAKLGVNVKVGVGIANLSKWLNFGMYVEVGVYTEIDGVLHKNFKTDDFYAAAYFETGLYLEVGAYYRLIIIKDEIKIADCKIPILRIGYDSIYYNYENEQFSVELTEKTYELDLNEILKVRSYDLKNQKAGTVLLTETKSNGVKIRFECDKNYITWSSGEYSKQTNKYSPLIITVLDTAPCEIEGVFRIVVTGNTNWLNYKEGGVAVQLDNFEIEFSGILHDTVHYEEIPPTCTKDGREEYIECAKCKVVIKEANIIPSFGGHDLESHIAKEPTCTEIGWNAYEVCLRESCDYTTYKEILAIGHNWKDADCLNPKTCSNCSKTEGDPIEHNWSLEYSTNENYHWIDCTVCGEKKDLAPHEYIDGMCVCSGLTFCNHVWVEATCTEAKTCSLCGVIEGNALGHEFDDGVCVRCEEKEMTPYEYFTFTLLEDDTYSIAAKNVNNMPAEVVLPSTYEGKAVTVIAKNALFDCSGLTSIKIPNSVTLIGDFAFYGCDSLTSVEIPDSVTLINDGAFERCGNLTYIKVSESNANYKDIEGDLYSKDGTVLIQYSIGKPDTSFITLDSITSISERTFAWCDNLTSVIIGDSVTSIGRAAFDDCDSLISVVIGNNVTSIDRATFYGCHKLTSVVMGDRVTSIGEAAFFYCNSLMSIEIPDLVTSIGDDAFRYCRSLTSIEIPNSVISIGDRAFFDCESLTSLVIGDSVSSIGDDAFLNCSRLTSIVIPNSVTYIGDGAFESCSNLKIYCEAESKPNGWHADWNICSRAGSIEGSDYIPVVWGYNKVVIDSGFASTRDPIIG